MRLANRDVASLSEIKWGLYRLRARALDDYSLLCRPAGLRHPNWKRLKAGSPPMGVGRLRLELTKSVPFFPGTNTGLPKGHVDWLAGGSERITRDSYKGLP
jgi:hypothetical protein